MDISVNIYWRLFLNSDNAEFARNFMRNLEIQFGIISILKMVPYWKDKTLYEIEFTQIICTNEPPQLFYQLIIKATLLSNKWKLNVPTDLSSNYLEINGVADEITKVKGLKWASFSLE